MHGMFFSPDIACDRPLLLIAPQGKCRDGLVSAGLARQPRLW